jgi:hypothetical protein
MRGFLAVHSGVVLAAIVLFCSSGQASNDLTGILKNARQELRGAKVLEKETELRLKIIENVAKLKAYYPAVGGRPEYRNPRYWKLNAEDSYVPRGDATEAIRDLWRTKCGIRCTKLSTLVMLKAMIDVADAQQLGNLNRMLQGKAIPDDLPKRGVGTIFEKPKPKNGGIFQAAELLPGDEVWFENPYFRLLSRQQQPRFYGQEGHHVFYIGDNKVMDMYSRESVSIPDFRKTFLRWKSVKIAAEQEQREPKTSGFQIKAIRRVILGKPE